LSSILKLKQKKIPFRMITWFRILLWWGSEMAKQMVQVRKPEAQIQFVYQSTTHFPKSKWGINKERPFCMVQRITRNETRIHLFSERSLN